MVLYLENLCLTEKPRIFNPKPRVAPRRCAQCSPNRTKTITTKNMELERTLSNMEFPLCYQNVIADINLEKANDFVKAMLNTIVNKYGSITVKNEIERDSSNSPISNHLTHIIEVGGLKIISDNKLYKNRQDEFQDIIVSVVFVLNCSLAIELKNLNLYNGDTSNYYGNDAILTIAKRLAKHTNDGINYSNGFEYYSNIMVIENLLNKITN